MEEQDKERKLMEERKQDYRRKYPNLQNIPCRSELGRKIRAAFARTSMNEYEIWAEEFFRVHDVQGKDPAMFLAGFRPAQTDTDD